MPEFHHHDLTLLNPAFDSPLVDVVNELEYLRRLELRGTTPAPVFFQLKTIFHMLESLGSARIEGNHTTLADYVESKLDSGMHPTTDTLREMENIEAAMEYIEQHVAPGDELSEHFIRECHDMTVRDLKREGDATPGAYRLGAVRIAQSAHLPPEAIQVPQYMQELVAFINEKQPPKYDLMKVALAHHRFGWIHPFSNGNGRVVRLLTYALLIKYGFNVKTGGRVLNPAAVFCNDRDHYYAMLARADAGTIEGRQAWCVYVLQGILQELSKVDRLTDYAYLSEKILVPTIAHASERMLVTPMEAAILRIACKHGVAKAADFTIAMPNLSAPQRTYQIRKLVERKMLEPISPGARQYTIGFSSSYLMRSIIRALSEEGFIPPTLSSTA
jgi:Fic family protein